MEKDSVQPSQDNNEDFSGNYLEKFQDKKNSEEFFPGTISSWERVHENTLIFTSETTALELTVLTARIIKFRFANDGYFEDDFSYAIDPGFSPEQVDFQVEEQEDHFLISTPELHCCLSKYSFLTRITDKEGHTLLEDEKGFHWRREKRYGGKVVINTKHCQPGESYYGLGDKSGNLNLLNRRYHLWGTDCYGYTETTDPVYKNIPFYIGLHENRAYGVFMDNSFRSYFDFAAERKDVTSFWAQGGEMRYYFIYGPEMVSVTEQYARLTGTHAMPPKWALGYQQSKWSYYPESAVRALAKKFRNLRIPCDVIHLDIDYMDGYRCFTWDETRFPDPQKMHEDLAKDGFRTVAILDPGIKVDKNYSVYRQGMENGYFCTRADGPKMTGSVWPGPCHFPDFTNPKVREWWSGMLGFYAESGVSGVWNDMNEPAVFEDGTFPMDVRHDYDGHPCSHRKAHNVYGMQMARATHDGQKKAQPDKRPLTIARSGYAGMQRYTAVWTGDNVATWDHLRIANTQMQRLASSGISFSGSDVGGFIGTPKPELYLRWIQLAVFHPFFRTHSSGDHGDKEPWVFGTKYTNLVRQFIEFRYQLLPYIYTAFWQHSQRGTPFLKSLVMVAQDDPETHFREDEFIVGDNLMVCPVVEEGATERLMYIPKGSWYFYWDNECYEGPGETKILTPLHQVPLFVRAGTVLPMQPKMQYVDEFVFEQLDLLIYYGEKECISELYEDEGDGYAYREGHYALKTFRTYCDNDEFIIEQRIEGTFDPAYQSYVIVLNKLPEKKVKVLVDGEDKTQELIKRNDTVLLTVPKTFQRIQVA